MEDGSLLVAEIATGSITRLSGADFKQAKVVADGLAGPGADGAGRDGAVYVTEAAGKLTRINLADGSKTTRGRRPGAARRPGADALGHVRRGRVGRAPADRDRPRQRQRRSVAENLPIGLAAGPGMPPPYVPTGVAVGADGAVYFSADLNNAIYRVRPQR